MKTRFIIAALILATPLPAVTGPALSAEEASRAAAPVPAAATQAAKARYRSECGACHMAYPARLLPPHAWKRIMGSLDRHFGDNAELTPELQAELAGYLVDHAGRPRGYREPAAETLPRITTQRWFVHEHDELPRRMVTGNPRVRSFSNCAACHRGATRGHFSEHDLSIPGYGQWED